MQVSSSVAALSFVIAALLVWDGQANIQVLPDVLYYNLTTTSRIENFILQNQRQYAANAKSLETHLADFRKHFFERIDIIKYHAELIEMKLNEVDNKLNPLELLDDVNDYCVHKYRGRVPTLAAAKTNLTSCAQKVSNYDALVSAAESTRKNLNNYYANQFANSLKECKKKYPNMDKTNYSDCVISAIKTTNSVSFQNINSFHNQLKLASCSAKLKLKEFFDCNAAVVFNTFSSVGEVMGLVENCFAGHEFCPSCGDTDGVPSGRCPYHVSWHLADTDLNSEKISNPFKGISKTTPCLQVNFITRNVDLL